MAVTPIRGTASITPPTAGLPVDALSANLTGGYIFNPADAPADLYVDPTGPASILPNGTSMALAPGSAYYAVQASTLPVSVASRAISHYFVSVEWI